MNNISCSICADLISLVHNDTVSEDSRAAILSHIQHCPNCRALYKSKTTFSSGKNQFYSKCRQTIQIFSSMLMMLGIVY